MLYKIVESCRHKTIYAENIPALRMAKQMALALDDVVVLNDSNKTVFINERPQLDKECTCMCHKMWKGISI